MNKTLAEEFNSHVTLVAEGEGDETSLTWRFKKPGTDLEEKFLDEFQRKMLNMTFRGGFIVDNKISVGDDIKAEIMSELLKKVCPGALYVLKVQKVSV